MKKNVIKFFCLIAMICGTRESFCFKDFVANHPKIMGGVLLATQLVLHVSPLGDSVKPIYFLSKNDNKAKIGAGLSAAVVVAALFNHFCPGNMSFLGGHGGKLNYAAWIAGISYLLPYGVCLGIIALVA